MASGPLFLGLFPIVFVFPVDVCSIARTLGPYPDPVQLTESPIIKMFGILVLRGDGGRPHGEPPSPARSVLVVLLFNRITKSCVNVASTLPTFVVVGAAGDFGTGPRFIILNAGTKRWIARATTMPVNCCPDGSGPGCSGFSVFLSTGNLERVEVAI
jgi:hypothetical protein